MKAEDIARERARWRWVGDERPPNAALPGPGEESVWDYPRPPRVEPVRARVRVEFGGELIADTARAQRVCETGAPPTYYLPREDVRSAFLRPKSGRSVCEWKGVAAYYSLEVGDRFADGAVWYYPMPDPSYASLHGQLAFMAGRVDACFVGDKRVTPQPGDYYGGWITPGIVGPFKGEAGTEGW